MGTRATRIVAGALIPIIFGIGECGSKSVPTGPHWIGTCGQEGVATCAGNDRLVCVVGDGQIQWVVADTCSRGCENGECKAGPACADQCPEEGAEGCKGDIRVLCLKGDGCLRWAQVVKCSGGCSDGACVAGGEDEDSGPDSSGEFPLPPDCGDGVCGEGETPANCPQDCSCVPDCSGKACGSDGCGGSCGTCGGGTDCLEGQCLSSGCSTLPDGSACATQGPCAGTGICEAGTCNTCKDNLDCTLDRCVNGACAHDPDSGHCVIAVGGGPAKCISAGTVSPSDPCMACVPGANPFGWSPNDGAPCDDHNVCTIQDACAGGVCKGTMDPHSCFINDLCIQEGQTALGSPCKMCVPAISQTDWSVAPDGTACVDDKIDCTKDACVGGLCRHDPLPGFCLTGSIVMPTCTPKGELDPASPCRICDPDVNPVGFTNLPLGSPCASDGLPCTDDTCVLAICTHAPKPGFCAIGGLCHEVGQANPANGCQVCDAGAQTAWTPVKDGTPCADDGQTCTVDQCVKGVCQHSVQPGFCLLDGKCIGVEEGNPAVECLECPAGGTTWIPKPDGAPCGDDGADCTLDLCVKGECGHTVKPGFCRLDGACYPDGAPNPKNDCEQCDSAHPDQWTPRKDGLPCKGNDTECIGHACEKGACMPLPKAGFCLIDGKCFLDGGPNPADPCTWCDSQKAPEAWSVNPQPSLWTHAYGGQAQDTLAAVIPGIGGGFVSAGATESSGNPKRNGWVLAVDGQGKKLWEVVAGKELFDTFHDVAASASEYAAAGSTGPDGWLVRVGTDGKVLTDVSFPTYQSFCCVESVTGADGTNYVLAGIRKWNDGTLAPAVLQVDPTGKMLWEYVATSLEPNAAQPDGVNDLIVTPDGAIVIAGRNRIPDTTTYDWFAIRLKADGTESWVRHGYVYSADAHEEMTAIRAVGTGFVAAGVIEKHEGSYVTVPFLATLGPSGTIASKVILADRKDLRFHSLEVLDSGDRILAGGPVPDGKEGIHVLRVGQDGKGGWDLALAGMYRSGDLTPAGGGKYAVAGWTDETTNGGDGILAVIDADGRNCTNTPFLDCGGTPCP